MDITPLMKGQGSTSEHRFSLENDEYLHKVKRNLANRWFTLKQPRYKSFTAQTFTVSISVTLVRFCPLSGKCAYITVRSSAFYNLANLL